MLRDFIKTHSQAEDVQLYRELVISGQLYQYFGSQLQLRGIFPPSPSEDLRKRAKKELFRAFFDRNQAVGYADSHALRIFKELFPNVYTIFSRIKSGNYKTLACALQNLEAEVVLFKTSGELAGNYPSLPLFTIHDSIATYREDIDTVKEALSRNIAEVIGAAPEIKIEHWDESLLEEQQEQVNELVQQSASLYGYVSDDQAISTIYTWPLKSVAKQLGVSPRKIHALLRDKGILQQSGSLHNIPLDQYMEAGYFIVSEKFKMGAGLIRTPKVTTPGIQFLKRVFKGG